MFNIVQGWHNITGARALFMFTRGLKTNKSAARRIRLTGNGDFKHKRPGRNHGNANWSRSKVLRQLNATVRSTSTTQRKKFAEYLPFAKKR